MNYKILTNDDYADILDISKNIWEGTDYLPKVFHKWVNDKNGCFLGLVKNDKVVALGKYTILPDGQGWLEGLRVHVDYRGQQLAHAIADMLFNIAREDLRDGKITNIAICTHKDTKASIKMVESKNFKFTQSCMVLFKNPDSLIENTDINSFNIETWNISYKDFKNLNYFKTCNNKLISGFTYLNLCEDVYNDLVKNNSLLIINGHKCIVTMKACPSVICIDNSFEGINDATNYALLKSNAKEAEIYIPNPDDNLVNLLKNNKFKSMSDFEKDCVYYVYKE